MPSKNPDSVSRRTPADAHLDALDARIELHERRVVGHMDKVEAAIAENQIQLNQLTTAIQQLTAAQRETNKKLDTLGDRIDQQRQAIDGHLKVAQEQSANVSELTKLVATQAQTVQILISRAS